MTATAVAGSKKITEYFGTLLDVVESDSDGEDTDDDCDEHQSKCSKNADEILSKLETEKDLACWLADIEPYDDLCIDGARGLDECRALEV